MTLTEKIRFKRIKRRVTKKVNKLKKEKREISNLIEELQTLRKDKDGKIASLEKELLLTEWGLNH
jgi:predicted CopG family antitoxin